MPSHKYKTISGIKCVICDSTNITQKFAKEEIVSSADLLECKNCGLVFLEQVNKAVAEEDKYWNTDKQEKVYLDQQIEEKTKQDFQKKLNLISRFIPRGTLLDIGCGTGQFLNLAKGEGWNVYGLDISPQAAKIAKEQYGIQVFTGRPEEFETYGVSFDCVTMWDVIEHFTEPQRALLSVKSKMREDGLLVIRTPNENALIRSLARMFTFLGFRSFLKYVYYTPHYFYFNPKTLKKLLIKSGYKIAGVILENTDEDFAQKKIQAHYKANDKLIVRFFLPFVLFISTILHRQNKLVLFARKR